jgi:hypothetical protein
MQKYVKTLGLSVAVTIAAAISAHASLAGYDGFGYTGIGNGTLTNASGLTYVDATTSGGGSFGFAGRWTTVAAGTVSYNTTGLGYTDLYGNSLITSGGSAIIGSPLGATASSQASRTMAIGSILSGSGTSAVYAGFTNSAQSIWVSYIMQWVGPQTAGSTTNLYVRKGDIAMRTGAQAQAAGGGTATVTVEIGRAHV